MKKYLLLLMLICAATTSSAMNCLQWAGSKTLELLNLHQPSTTYEQQCLTQRQKLENVYEDHDRFMQTLQTRADAEPSITSDGKSVQEFTDERDAASAQKANLLKRQGTLQRYKDGFTALVTLATGVAHGGYKIWFTESENNEDRQILTAAVDFWPDILLVLTGGAGIVKFFVNTNGRILNQSLKENEALSALQDASFANQVKLIKLLQEQKTANWDTQLKQLEALPVSESTNVAMQNLSSRIKRTLTQENLSLLEARNPQAPAYGAAQEALVESRNSVDSSRQAIAGSDDASEF